MKDDREPYLLEEIIKKCENIRDGVNEGMNYPRAIYTLALEIKYLKDNLETLSNHYHGHYE